jgi:hypothetical protein
LFTRKVRAISFASPLLPEQAAKVPKPIKEIPKKYCSSAAHLAVKTQFLSKNTNFAGA